ncbi:class I SAM-dependent methyltransferase [uncultured Gimesia sp.]|jgi:ubiquinone/menaquinone biosynthesis C-methylase UbiE|uniref:class I SAM-dependent methyltransferase n=1 Tax=uncultured Gimesia sp. TaxID=1678688 RepID=UPI00263891C8|nr:class I SAM-dependent methyltransferase [uncultured Gimesia sp.]
MSTSDEKLTKSFYDRISHSYDLLADSNEHVAREKGLKALAISAGETVLEIGYGTGHSLVSLAEAVGETGSVYGVDISDGMKKVSEKRVTEAGIADRVNLSVAITPPLPFDDQAFDVVSMSFTLELFPLETIPTVLQEIRRVLKPGGRLGVVSMALPKEGDKDSFLEKTYKWMHQHFPHIVDCQPIDAAGFLKDAGFTITAENSMDIWTMPVAVLVGTSPA